MLVEKLLHGGKALFQTLSVQQGAADPFSEKTLAEPGESLVDSPEEATPVGMIGGVAVDFEAFQGCTVNQHVGTRTEALKVFRQTEYVL